MPVEVIVLPDKLRTENKKEFKKDNTIKHVMDSKKCESTKSSNFLIKKIHSYC